MKRQPADLEHQLEECRRELAEAREYLAQALERQTATSEVLEVISSSSGELEPVFQAMLDNAMRICTAKFGIMFEYANGAFRALSSLGIPSAFKEFHREARVWGPGTGLGQLARTKQTVHIHDTRADRAYTERDPGRMAAVEIGGVRTFVAVPMLKGSDLIGAIVIFRQEVRPFTDKQIELVTNFAAQAVIAIENTRLLNELRQRTHDLSDALERQTAASEVLQVISSSAGELGPVFEAMLENAQRICEAKFGFLWRIENGKPRIISRLGIPPALAAYLKRGPHRPPLNRPGPLTAISRVIDSRQTVHIADYRVDPSYLDRDPLTVAAVELGGVRTLLIVPMLKSDELVGAIGIYRLEVRPFTDKQIELVKNFAAQAVIAIENTRLLNELRESLAQQTATADVLKVISGSPGDLEPVFNAMLENATRICEAKFGTLSLFGGDELRVVAMHGAPPAYEELRGRDPRVPTVVRRRYEQKEVWHIADLTKDERYANTPLVTHAGARTYLGVPLLKENELIGHLTIYRQEVRPFTDKQIDLLTNFAAQAVIAIENTRLLNELRESLQQQTATSEVLQVISSSPGQLGPVFQAMLENATRICEARFGTMLMYEDGTFREVAQYNLPSEYANVRPVNSTVFRAPPGGTLAQIVETKQVVHVEDLATRLSAAKLDETLVELIELGGARSILAVPMLAEDKLVGALGIYRQEVRPFTAKHIELVKNFAAQAVIAIENTRLLNELRESLQQQTATADVLKVISGSPGDLEPVFQAMLENATRICEAKFGNLYLHEEGVLRIVASHNVPPAFAEARRRGPFHPAAGGTLAEAIRTKQTAHLLDLAATRVYLERDPAVVDAVELGGVRTTVAVPMLKDNELIGLIAIFRQEVRPFTDKQIELVANFANQAVIAIENTRLLKELRESLQQQTATADVLKVISRSTFDLQTVLTTLVESAAQLCQAESAHIFRRT